MYKKGQLLICKAKPNQYYTIGKKYEIRKTEDMGMSIIDGTIQTTRTSYCLLNNKGIINWWSEDILRKHFLTIAQIRELKLEQLKIPQ